MAAHARIMPPNPVRPLAALRALGKLINDPEDTGQVFHIIRALSGRSFERLFHRVLADPVGARILNERRQLLPVLSDRERLRGLPEGTLGHTYARFMDAERITADGLEAASMVESVEWYDKRAGVLSDRLRDMHDLWHVVTGYGRDLLGEAALLAFTYAQLRNRGVGFIAAAGAFKLRQAGFPRALPVVWQAYKRGRQANFLAAADWQALLELPLEEVRNRLAVGAPPAYEPIVEENGIPIAA